MSALTGSEVCRCGHVALIHDGADYSGACTGYRDIGVRKDGKRRVVQCDCRVCEVAATTPNTECEAA